jgi:formate hydrogenlyase subunit 3/multisubunit Na+/H+ antiporter MnhD subunit
MHMTDLLLLALFQIPALALAAALAYQAQRTRTLGSYVMFVGALVSLAVSVASNFVPQTHTLLFDSSGKERGVMVSAGNAGLWLTYSRVTAALLLALGAILLARQGKRPLTTAPPNNRWRGP